MDTRLHPYAEPPEWPKIGKLNYLVMIFDNSIPNSRGQGAFDGFLNDKCQYIGQFFAGNKEVIHFGKIVQLPHLFPTKKKAKEAIINVRRHDRGFARRGLRTDMSYEIVPIDIDAKLPEEENNIQLCNT